MSSINKMNRILIDSSVWISASNSKNPECLKLKRLLLNESITLLTLLPIQTEVSQGVRDKKIINLSNKNLKLD